MNIQMTNAHTAIMQTSEISTEDREREMTNICQKEIIKR